LSDNETAADLAIATAQADGVAALTALVSMRQCLEALEHIAAAPNDYARAALFSGLIVSYARAFEPAINPDTKVSRSFGTKKLPGFCRKLHKELIQIRDRYIAHAGHSENDYTVMFVSLMVGTEPVEDLATKVAEGAVGQIHLGSRAQACVCIGPSTTEAQGRLRDHLVTLQTAAAARLAHAIGLHQSLVLERLQRTGSLGRRPPRVISSGTATIDSSNGQAVIGPDVLLLTDPRRLDELGLSFTSVFYTVTPSDPGQMQLHETTKRTDAAHIAPSAAVPFRGLS